MDLLSIGDAPRPLGADGPTVSPLAWGMWRLQGDDVAAVDRLARTALDLGITLFDTADIYAGPGEPFGAAEALFGRLLAEAPDLRGRLFLATKGGIQPGIPYRSSGPALIAACEASLSRLKTDHIDLYQIHRPDLLAHPAESAEALDRLVEQGKIGAIGVSNYTAAQVAALARFLGAPLISHQIGFSPLAIAPLSDGTLDQALERGLGIMAWSPLGGGRLGGAGEDERGRAVIAVLDRLAAEFGVARAAVAYAWLMAHPARPIPILGTQSPARLKEAVGAFAVRLTPAQWYEVLTAARGVRLP